MRLLAAHAIALLSILAFQSTVRAADVIWAGAGSGNWTNGYNWVGGSVPGTTDTVSFKGFAPLVRTGWTVTAYNTSGSQTASLTKDGRRSTYWWSGTNMTSSSWVQIDLGSTQTFGGIDMVEIQNGTDFPSTYSVYVSSDASSWGSAIYSTSSGDGDDSMRFSDQSARYIKIVTAAKSNWWAINELTVWGTAGDTQYATTGFTASSSTSYNNAGDGPASNAIDFVNTTRFTTGAAQANGQWFTVNMGASRTISAVTMDSYSWTDDYPGTYKVELSTTSTCTGTSGTYTQVASASPSSEFIHVTFTAQSARCIRVTLTATHGSGWWSIGEFHIFGQPVDLSTQASLTAAGIKHANAVTLTQGSGHTITLTGDWTQSAGTFTGGSSQISVGGDLNLSGGTYTSTSGLLEVSGAYNATGGTFTHNSGRVLLDSTSDQTFASNGNTFNDLTINDGLVGYWKLDETATPSADSSGWGRSGAWSGAGIGSSTTVPALNFTNSHSLTVAQGTSDKVTITSPSVPAITVTAWVYSTNRTSGGGFPRILEMPVYQLSIADGAQPTANCVAWTATAATSGQYSYRSPANGFNDLTLYHIAASMDAAGTGKIWINGVSQTVALSGAGSGGVSSANSGSGYIGNRLDGLRPWNGRLDDLRVYNRVLSDSEVYSLYIGNQPGTGLATQTLTGSPTVLNDLTLASGTLSAGTNTITVGGDWNNFGGLFTAGTGTVSLTNGCCTYVIRSAGQPFYNLKLNGTNGIWNLEDWLKVSNTLSFLQNGTLVPGAYAIHAGNISKTSGSLTAGTGTVVIDTTSNVTESSGFSFNNLRIEASDESNLVGYWKLDEGQGTSTLDASGNGNTGTSAASWIASSLPSTGFDNHAAASFNGTSDFVSLGSPAALNFSGQITMAAWINTASTSGVRNIVAHGYNAAGNSEVFLRIDNGTYEAGSFVASTTYQTTYAVPGGDANAWVHMAVVYDGTTWRLYHNGSAVGTPLVTANGSITIASTNWAIGARGDGTSRFFSGKIDDVRIYNTALTATQIANLAQGRYSGIGGGSTITLGANSSASGALSIDSGTLYSSSYTTNASSASNVVSVGSGATYHIGSATQTMSGGLTVYDKGTVTMDTASGKISVGSGKTLTMNGTLNASSTSATIQSVSGTYTFSVGTTATPAATPTLNITGLAVKNTDANGMNINVDHAVSTTFTRFDNIAFTNGAGTGAGNYNLQVYATSLYLTANGCSFDSGVTATVANNVKLTGNGTGDGETRIMFGNATCASDKTSCEAYDSDDDSTADGIGDNSGSNAAVIQWISGAEADTSGSIEGFPTAAFDWSSYTWYSSYVAFHDVSGSTDRVYARKTNGDSYYYWDEPSGGDLIGTPRWDTVGGVHYVYVATTTGKVYRLIDNTTAHTLTADTASPWDGANNPFDCSCTISTPLAQDTGNLYFGGVVSATYKLWTVSKTSTTRQPTGSPLLTGATTNNAAPAVWVSGHTYVFEGQAGRVTKLDVTPNMSLIGDNTNPGSSNAVTGRITVISNTLYAGDDNGYMWSLDPGSNFVGTTKNWGYHDATNHAACGGVCQVKNHYVDAQYTHTIYGDQDGHLYVLDSTGVGYKPTSTTLYPWRPGTSADPFATAPLYRGGVIVIGSTNGFLYIVDQNKDNTVPALIQTYKFGGSSTAVSGIAYDYNSGMYMVSTANATNKDGKLYYIAASSDPTGGFL